MKYLLLPLISICVFSVVKSQPHKNTIYAEFGGNGILASINYERHVLKQKAILHSGIGISGAMNPHLTIPFGIKYNKSFGKRNHLEFGMGGTATKADITLYAIVDRLEPVESKWRIYPIPSIGYKHTTNNGYLFRTSLCPVISRYGVLPWLGFSFGRSF